MPSLACFLSHLKAVPILNQPPGFDHSLPRIPPTLAYLLGPLLSDPGDPDKELNPKKKVWEQVQPDLLTDNQGVATYKGAAFEVTGKGVCKAQTLYNSGIR